MRSLVCFKSVGLNVALDSLMVSNLAGGDGGFVILTGDDPGGWGSQNEQDSRPLIAAAQIPMLEPSTPAEGRTVIQRAYDLAERIKTPVAVRITQAMATGKGPVASPLQVPQSRIPARFRRQEDRWTVTPAREQAAAEKQRAADAERKRAAEAEAKRKAAEDATRKQAEAAETRRKAEAQAQAAREERSRAEREADLRRQLAAEEEAAAVAQSGVMDEYRALLVQTIERNWIRPPSARAGLQCTLYVTQALGGTVIDVKLGACNGDQAVRESIANAVYKSSPLPAPRDPRAFERRLEIVFMPRE